MIRPRLASFLAGLVLTVAVVGGCTLDKGTDSSGDTPNPPNQGNLTDDEYESNSEALSMTQGYTSQMIAEMFSGIGRVDSISGAPALMPGPGSVFAAGEADSVVISYDGSTGYWHVVIEADDSAQGLTLTFADSLQMRSAGGVVQWPDETVNQVRAGLRLTAVALDGSPNAPTRFELDFSEEFVMIGEIMTEGIVTVNGDGAFLADVESSDDSSSCAFLIDMTVDLWDIEIDLATIDQADCPIGGTMATTGALDWYCTGGGLTMDVSGEWEAMATYDGTNVVVVVQDGVTSWTYDGPCSEL